MTTKDLQKTEGAEARRLPEVIVTPAVDVIEREDAYAIVADLPGVDPQHLDLAVGEGVLTIEGEVAAPEQGAGESICREFGPVRYRRTFDLGEDIDETKGSASLKNGVLRLTLPKAAHKVPRKIAIEVG